MSIENEYSRASFRLWSACIEESSKEKAAECQMDAAKYLVSERPFFTAADGKVIAMEKLDSYDRQRFENL